CTKLRRSRDNPRPPIREAISSVPPPPIKNPRPATMLSLRGPRIYKSIPVVGRRQPARWSGLTAAHWRVGRRSRPGRPGASGDFRRPRPRAKLAGGKCRVKGLGSAWMLTWLALSLVLAVDGEAVRLPVVRDTWFSNVGPEA